MKKVLLAAYAVALVAGCSSQPTFQEGPDAEVTFDGLTRMEGTVMDLVWARTDIDLKGYTKVKFESLGVEFRPVTGPYSGRAGMGTTRRTNQSVFPMDEATQQLFIEEMRGAFLEEIGSSEVFQVVEESGPDVLLIRIGLHDVISRVPPETTGRSFVWIDRVGEATLVLEIRDAESKAILARAVDRRAAEQPGSGSRSTSVTNRAEVRRLARRWASIVRDGLDTMLTDGLQASSS